MSHFKLASRGIETSFKREERVFLRDIVPMLESLGERPDDPAYRRLNVPVYLDDPESNEEWWRLMGSELETVRVLDREVFARMLGQGSTVLTLEEAASVLRVINESRLALGARLGVEVEEDHDRLEDGERQVLDYLGWILEELIEELSKTL